MSDTNNSEQELKRFLKKIKDASPEQGKRRREQIIRFIKVIKQH